MKLLSLLSFSLCAYSLTQNQAKSWSNRKGEIIRGPICDNIYAIERPFLWNNIDVGGRSVVIKSGDNLIVHSPVESTEELREQLKLLGNVKYIISPNYEHLKYAKQWSEVYPDAIMCACPGLPPRMPDIKWDIEFPPTNTVTNTFPSEIDYLHFDCEINPFTSKPFFNEVIFFHQPTHTLFMSDTYWNYPSSSLPNYATDALQSNLSSSSTQPPPITTAIDEIPVPIGARAWKFGMDRIYLPFYKRFMVGKKGIRREKYDILVNHILNIWKPQIIIPCHGDVVYGEELCRRVLMKHFDM